MFILTVALNQLLIEKFWYNFYEKYKNLKKKVIFSFLIKLKKKNFLDQ